MEHYLEQSMIQDMRAHLAEGERSRATIEKYTRDVQAFYAFVKDGPVNKEKVLEYKQHLAQRYAPASVNSMLAALSCFLKRMGWYECVVKTMKVQQTAFRSREKVLSEEEYRRLLDAARQSNPRLYYLMQTICSTGIRVSELPFITVEAVQKGSATVTLKGKTRVVLLPSTLCRLLKQYISRQGIKSGSVFVARSGKPLDRSYIWREMKALSRKSGVGEGKIFPHNLRHLFAYSYYKKEKDLASLADLLGHSSINTTRIYVMISDEEQSRRIDALGLVV